MSTLQRSFCLHFKPLPSVAFRALIPNLESRFTVGLKKQQWNNGARIKIVQVKSNVIVT